MGRSTKKTKDHPIAEERSFSGGQVQAGRANLARAGARLEVDARQYFHTVHSYDQNGHQHDGAAESLVIGA